MCKCENVKMEYRSWKVEMVDGVNRVDKVDKVNGLTG
jgi:hypothetical protein